jgi:hypothetical protein
MQLFVMNHLNVTQPKQFKVTRRPIYVNVEKREFVNKIDFFDDLTLFFGAIIAIQFAILA